MAAPIILFVYKRLDYTKKTIQALLDNDLSSESELFIFSDYPKNEADFEAVKAVRDYIRTVKGFSKVNIIEQTSNLGLANSVTSGVTKIVNEFGKCIVLEDDIVVSPYFLKYMNDGLIVYENDSQVASICGYMYPIENTLPDTVFLKGADCWGWATWKRAWDIFEFDSAKLLRLIDNLQLSYSFDIDGEFGYYGLLKTQVRDKRNSWAICWHASAFIHKMYSLHPGKTMVKNIGFDVVDSTHMFSAAASKLYMGEVSSTPLSVEKKPVTCDDSVMSIIIDHMVKIQDVMYAEEDLKIFNYR